jgi:hypothetical protein
MPSSAVWPAPERRYPEHMGNDAAPDTDKPGTALLKAAGMTSTPEGREKARQALAEGRARLTPEVLAGIRAQLGLPPRTA